ncbi:hypothetical protein BIZ83_gp094 [Erwinia phage vB_EamM_ChrisDB]|uniref:hypothetical protein n=1 Tax=Erwinia phage vB_EamM_ChrisDB TaxID=1883371 RepID=UPI00081C34BF|nr:hypothetical protein BIZ83_gp094 [Erwinia phage vB_EamM_ChrisDB]ANZ48759.1 hypothetical protein CHRISDB_197 [Erwinia phage vB_EamM_ChrisDB]
MKVLDRAIAKTHETNDATFLINAVVYKVCQRRGKQVVPTVFADYTDLGSVPEDLVTKPDIVAAEDDRIASMAPRITELLAKHYRDVKDLVIVVKLKDSVTVEGTVDFGGQAFPSTNQTNIILQVKVTGKDKVYLNFHSEFVDIDAPWWDVAMPRLPLPEATSEDDPVYLMSSAYVKDVCMVDGVDVHILDSVSIAALAIGWSDSESYGNSLLLLN